MTGCSGKLDAGISEGSVGQPNGCPLTGEMNADPQEVPVLKSSEPDAFVKAVELLQAARIPFRVIDTPEGWEIPHTTRWILVPEASAEEALLLIADVPSEIPTLPETDTSRGCARMLWVSILIVLVIIAVAVIIGLVKI